MSIRFSPASQGFALLVCIAFLLLSLPLSAQAGKTAMLTSSSLSRNQHQVTVAIATRAIPRGVVLQAADFALTDTVITWRWNGQPEIAQPSVGWITHRSIAKGEILQSPGVTPAPLITSGRTITAIWQDNNIRLVLSGVATNSAALGESVGIRIDRVRRLDGIAVAPDTVRLR